MSEEESIDFLIDTEVNQELDQIETELLMSHASMVDKLAEREQLNKAIEVFISSGGQINHVNPNIMADPPKKPENKYGSHPI